MQGELELLRNQEKELTTEAKKIQKNLEDAKEIAAKIEEENKKDIAKSKKLLNDAQTDSELSIKYLEQEMAGEEDC